jgi:hypothetical protein
MHPIIIPLFTVVKYLGIPIVTGAGLRNHPVIDHFDHIYFIWLVVGTMEVYDVPIILGMSSSQLTFTPSFFRGIGLNHQPDIII